MVDPLPLRAQRGRALEYLHGIDFRFGSVLAEIMRHAFRSADPLCASLALWTCEACGGAAETMLPIAGAIECLHRFAALHDELEDGYEGEASSSSQWGLSQTLNAGDAFHAVALCLLAADAYYPDRALAASVMLTQTVMRRVEQRARLAASGLGSRTGERGRLRAASEATWTLMLAASLHAGAICAGTAPGTGATLSRAGRFLGITLQLASGTGDRAHELAQRYAAKAISEIERSPLSAARRHDFKEIAHYVATGSPAARDHA
jgi:geranylgeranyl pyrophosphate synthase